MENGSSISILVQIREVVTWLRIWDQALDWSSRWLIMQEAIASSEHNSVQHHLQIEAV